MKLGLLRCGLCIAASAALWGSDYNSPSRMADAPSWRSRASALQRVLAQHPLSDPAVQEGILKMLTRESNDPNWEALDEDLGYESYYGDLLAYGQRIATEFHNAAAFPVLTHTYYNEDSPFAEWLVAQPGVLAPLIETASDGSSSETRAVWLLGEVLARCARPNAPDCSAAREKRDQILSLIRRRAEAPTTQFSAIVALGLCGTRQDLSLLKKIEREWEAKNMGPDFYQIQGQKATLDFIHKSEQQIESRIAGTPRTEH